MWTWSSTVSCLNTYYYFPQQMDKHFYWTYRERLTHCINLLINFSPDSFWFASIWWVRIWVIALKHEMWRFRKKRPRTSGRKKETPVKMACNSLRIDLKGRSINRRRHAQCTLHTYSHFILYGQNHFHWSRFLILSFFLHRSVSFRHSLSARL